MDWRAGREIVLIIGDESRTTLRNTSTNYIKPAATTASGREHGWAWSNDDSGKLPFSWYPSHIGTLAYQGMSSRTDTYYITNRRGRYVSR